MTTKPSNFVNWFQVFMRGQRYMKTWHTDKRLSPVFPENRVINSTRFGVRFMPPLAIFTLAWQVALGGQLGPAIATALFACGLPLPGLWWLGKRSITPLPPVLLQWFHEVRNKLVAAEQAVAPLDRIPTYQSLAELLKCAFKQLDKAFLDDL